MTGATAIWLTIMTVGVLTLVTKLWDLRRNPDSLGLRWLCVAIGSTVLGYAAQYNSVRVWVDGLTQPGTDWVIGTCLTVVACFAAQAFFLHMTRPDVSRHVRIRMWITCGMIALVLLSSVVFGSNYVEFTMKLSGPDEVPTVAVHAYLIFVYLGFVTFGAAMGSLAYARVATRFSLRLGLAFIAVGMLLCVGFSIVRITMAAGYQLGLLPPGMPFDALPGAFFRLAIPLIFLGAVLPSLGARLHLDRLAAWCMTCLRNYQLFPIWRSLTSAFPEIVLHAERRRMPVRGAEKVLHRRMIEIWDARLRLRPFMDPGVDARVKALARDARLAPRRLDATVEAARLKVGLVNHAEQSSADRDTGAVSLDNRGSEADAVWLASVSREFQRSSLVARLAALDGRPSAEAPTP